MNISTWIVLLFLAAVNIQRGLETFKRRPNVPGRQQMRWSFYAFFSLHMLIMIGALVEFLLLRKRLLWPWSAAGFVLYVMSVVLRNVAIRTLGRFWSLHVEIRAEHALIREGIYRFIRHPAYSAIVLEVLSIPMVVNAWWTLLFAGLTYVPLLLARLRCEERALVEKFGDSYRVYQREVGALLPHLIFLTRSHRRRIIP